jgi:colanic acid/amylovoran biosynthesis glycosyltransferase
MKIWLYNGSLDAPPFIHGLQKGLHVQGVAAPMVGFGEGKGPWTGQTLELGRVSNRIAFAAATLAKMALTGRVHLQQIRALSGPREQSRLAQLKRIALYGAILKHRPDIIHVQWAAHLSYFTWLFDEKTRPKIVLSLRGRLIHSAPLADPGLAAFYRAYFPRVDAFHAVSGAMARAATHYGASLERISVIYSGVDIPDRLPPARPAGGRFRLLSVGRHHWIKGYRIALEALARLRERGFPVHYTIVARRDPEETRFHIRELGLERQVSLLSGLSREEVFEQMHSADLLLLPSLGEGLANVALEAMAHGCLVLSADVGGMPELIRDGWNGLLFPARDVDQLAGKVSRVWRMPAPDRRRLIERARQTLHKRHRPGQMGRQMVDLYKKTLCA